MTAAVPVFAETVRVLKSSVNKTAIQGVLIAVAAIFIATGAVCYYHFQRITVDGLLVAQQNNFALWMLDFMPLVFAYWGQYAGSMIAYHAGALLLDQTRELRFKADTLERQASYAATHDACTGLPNRAMFYQLVEDAMARCPDTRMLAVLLVELENFRDVHDTLGPSSGESLLRQAAQRLSNSIHGADAAGCIDGHNFAVLLSDLADREEAVEGARRIQRTLEAPINVERLKLAVQTGIGIALYPHHGDDADALVQRAGIALCMANRSHPGYAVYDPAYDRHSPDRLTLMGELRQAVARDELCLYYQPKLCLKTDTLIGVEALVRWQHPVHGLMASDEFVPQAEKSRTIRLLTSWVLAKAFADCARWHRDGVDLKIAVNMSVKDLYDPELPDLVEKLAASAGVRPEWMVFEITESCISTDPERTREVVGRLSALGFKLSIDDFGTGYSSLAYLKRLPVSELKIDRSFVMDILDSENDAVIVNATINLAHNLGLGVTAEGVESADIMERLKSYGCDIAQGYHIGKPVSFEAINALVASGPWRAAFSSEVPGERRGGISPRSAATPPPSP